MDHGWRLAGLLAIALVVVPTTGAQQIEVLRPANGPRPAGLNRHRLFAPLGIARETARDFATFRDSVWNALTLAQIGAASADAATSLDNLRACPSCWEDGVSRFFVGRHPDAHKYLIGGAIEIGAEAVAAHYFRNHGPMRKWYWKTLWALPQSLSLFEHTRAAYHNAALDFGCVPSAPSCH